MNYAETIDYLFNALPVWEQKGGDAYKPGLERTLGFAASIGNPQQKFCSVHVAGTNGKGSTSSMLAAILTSAGYKTGLFTSPHLVDFRERIRIDGRMIPEGAVVEFAERYREGMLRFGLTFFEMATTMAFWWFAREGCDVSIIEVGLGGRLDTTNIITPAVSVVTNIGLEHTQYLGDTIAAIAGEKAGIIKPGVPVVIGETDSESAPVFRARAAELHSPIVFADTSVDAFAASANSIPPVSASRAPSGPPAGIDCKTDGNTGDKTGVAPSFRLDLAGGWQQKNLRTVLATVDILRRTFEIPDEALRRGLQNTVVLTGLRGRWEVVREKPLVVCDTAHNAHGFAEVTRQIARQKYDKLFMVLGFAADKDLASIIPLLPENAHYILTRADTPRAMTVEELARRFAESGLGTKATVETAPSVTTAAVRALSLAMQSDMIYIGGSNFVVGELLKNGQ